jgi:hypothetical protein
MDEKPQTTTSNSDNSSPASDKPVQVMDVKPPSGPSTIDNTISPEDVPAHPPLNNEPSIQEQTPNSPPTTYTPPPISSTPEPAKADPPKAKAGKSASPSPTAKLSNDQLAKILVIVIVALVLISAVLYFYMKHK